jgi:5-methylthioadenosine/S-adenosylhomocysteine deaminase
MSILLKNCRYVLTQDEKRRILKSVDVYIENDTITEIGKTKTADETIDCSRMAVSPGFVNSHTHIGSTIMRGYVDDLPFFDWLGRIWERENRLTEKEIALGAQLACLEMIKSGITSFVDMYPYEDSTVEKISGSGLRSYLSWPVIDKDKTTQKGTPIKNAERFLKHWKTETVTPLVGPHAIYSCEKELLIKAKKLADKNKTMAHIHAAETRKELSDCLKKNKKRVIEYLDSIGFLGSNVLAAHCSWLTKGEVRTLAERKTKVSACPVSNAKLGTGGAVPIPEMLNSGVLVTLGTDAPISNNSLNMFETMKFCSLLLKNQRWDASIVSAQDVFDFATINGAKALKLNAGSVEAGRKADLVLFDLENVSMLPLNNLLSNIVYSASPDVVDTVIVNGRFVMREKEMLTIDEHRLRDELL